MGQKQQRNAPTKQKARLIKQYFKRRCPSGHLINYTKNVIQIIGAFDKYGYVTFANTATEALGFCLEQEGQTSADGWNIEEIEQSVGANFIYSQN